MSELELNREYTYKQICEVLKWKCTTGTAKQAQIREIESAFEFEHPMNKKTHKEKKSYVFTKQLRSLNKPKRGGVYNTKTIQSMMDYLMQTDIITGAYKSFGRWLCADLKIFRSTAYDVHTYNEELVKAVCENNNISKVKLFCDYVRRAKFIVGDMFLRALSALEKQGKIEYRSGYMFVYAADKSEDALTNHFETDLLNDIVKKVETSVCNEIKEEHHLMTDLSGRQLLWSINNNSELREEFNLMKVQELMCNYRHELNLHASKFYQMQAFKKLLPELDEKIPDKDLDALSVITDKHPLLSYHKEVNILWKADDPMSNDTEESVILLTNKVREKTRAALLKSKWTDKGGNVWYNYDMSTDGDDMKKIEELLFVHFDPDFTPNVVNGWMKEFIFDDSDEDFNVDDI